MSLFGKHNPWARLLSGALAVATAVTMVPNTALDVHATAVDNVGSFTVNVNFDTQGGSAITSQAIHVISGDGVETVTLSENMPTKPGYVLNDWTVISPNPHANLAKNGVVQVVSANASSAQFLSTTLDDEIGIKLQAAWTPITYTASFCKNTTDDVDNITADNASVDYESGVALPATGYGRVGFSLNGWRTTPDGDKVYDIGQTVSGATTEAGATVIYYADWVANKYKLTYSMNGEAGASVSTPVLATFDITSTGELPTPTGYAAGSRTFRGWSTDPDLANFNTYSVNDLAAVAKAKITHKATAYAGLSESQKNLEIYAIFDDRTKDLGDNVTIRYYISGNETGYKTFDGQKFNALADEEVWTTSPEKSKNIAGDTEHYLKFQNTKDNMPTKEYYSFAGWGTFSSGSVTAGIYAVPKKQSADPVYPEKTLVLTDNELIALARENNVTGGSYDNAIGWEIPFFATFEPTKYTVKFNLNGGKVGGSSTYADLTDKVYNDNLMLPSPVKTGQQFLGWSVKTEANAENGDIIVKGTKTIADFYSKDEDKPLAGTPIVLNAIYADQKYDVVFNAVDGTIVTGAAPEAITVISGNDTLKMQTLSCGDAFVFGKGLNPNTVFSAKASEAPSIYGWSFVGWMRGGSTMITENQIKEYMKKDYYDSASKTWIALISGNGTNETDYVSAWDETKFNNIELVPELADAKYAENQYYYAAWTKVGNTATFTTRNDAKTVTKQKFYLTKSGEELNPQSITAVVHGAKDGYEWIGWYESEDAADAAGLTKNNSELATKPIEKLEENRDYTLYGAWRPVTYYLTFSMDGAMLAKGAAKEIATADTSKLEEVPVRFGEKIEFPDMSSYYEITPAWTFGNYILEGTISDSNKQVRYVTDGSKTYTIKDVLADKENIKAGINHTNDGTDGKPIILVPTYTAKKVTVAYEDYQDSDIPKDRALITEIPANATTKTFLKTNTLSVNDYWDNTLAKMNRTGFSFNGWFNGATDDPTKKVGNETAFLKLVNKGENFTLTASWSHETYVIGYETASGNDGGIKTYYAVQETDALKDFTTLDADLGAGNTTFASSKNAVEADGYEFYGWATITNAKSNVTGKHAGTYGSTTPIRNVYPAGTSIAKVLETETIDLGDIVNKNDLGNAANKAATLVVAPVFMKNNYYVVYKESTATTATATDPAKIDLTAELPTGSYTKENHKQVGWQINGTGKFYYTGAWADGTTPTNLFGDLDLSKAAVKDGKAVITLVPAFVPVYVANIKRADGSVKKVEFSINTADGDYKYYDDSAERVIAANADTGKTATGWTATSFNKEGYTLKGLIQDETSTKTAVAQVTDKVSSLKSKYTNKVYEITWVPLYEARSYSITYQRDVNAPGSDATKLSSAIKYTWDDKSKTFPTGTETTNNIKSNLSIAGYHIVGWSTMAYPKTDYGVIYKPGAEVYNISDPDGTDDGSFTLHAVYAPNEYKITFDKNEAQLAAVITAKKDDGTRTITGKMDDLKYSPSATVSGNDKVTLTVPAAGYTAPGYYIKGWTIAKAGTTATAAADIAVARDKSADVTSDSASYKKIITEADKTEQAVTLYAVWDLAQYKVQYVTNNENKMDDETYTITAAKTLSTPKKVDGNTFGGWFTDPTFSKKTLVDTIEKGSYGDKKFYALWNANALTVNFDGNGADNASAMKAQTVYYNVPVKLTKNSFKRKGYVFCGWKTVTGDTNHTIAYVDTQEVSLKANTTLYADWRADDATKPIVFDVTLSTKPGDVVEDAKVVTTAAEGYFVRNAENLLLYNGTYTKGKSTYTLPKVTREGYDFVGWKETTQGFTTTVMSTKYTQNLTFTPVFNAKKFRVTFAKGTAAGVTIGGPKTPYYQDVQYKVPVTLSACKYKAAGYQFMGWTRTAEWDGEDMSVFVNANAYSHDATQDITLYAQWGKVPHGVSLYTGAGNAKGLITSNTLDEGYEAPQYYKSFDEITNKGVLELGSYVPKIDGFTFDSWNTTRNTTTGVLSGKVTKIKASTTNTSDKGYQLYAKYKGGITVRYHNGESTFATERTELWKNYKVTKNQPSQSGQVFAGWTYTEGGQNVNCYSNQSILMSQGRIGYTIKVDDGVPYMDLYAVYVPATQSTFNVTLIPNGGILDGKEENKVITYSTGVGLSAKELKAYAPTAIGYKFIGWFDTINDKKVTSIAKTAVGDLQLYAKYKTVPVTITFDINAGILKNTKVSGKTKTIKVKRDGKITLPKVKAEGYTLLGWTTDNKQLAKDGWSQAELRGDTATARNNGWGFDWNNDGKLTNYLSGKGDKAEFWDEQSAFLNAVVTDPGIARSVIQPTGKVNGNLAAANGSTIYYAIWAIDEYNFTYDVTGGFMTVGDGDNDVKAVGSNYRQTFTKSANGTEIQTPVKAGYTFKGWQAYNGKKWVSAGKNIFNKKYTGAFKATWKQNK